MRSAGTVVRMNRKQAAVRLENGQLVKCFPGGRLFAASGEVDPENIAVGDQVELEHPESPRGRSVRIARIRPRQNELRRTTGPPHRREMRVLVVNTDGLLVVSAFRDPPYRTGLLDRALVIAFDAGMPPALVFNKSDLGRPADRTLLRRDLDAYRTLDLDVFETCATSGDGLARLAAFLQGRRTALVGHSGVGKSELLAGLGLGGRRRGRLDRFGRGRHTTTAAEILSLPGGGEVVDTPGFRALGLDGLTPERVLAAHPDLAPLADACRFRSCSHGGEPDCAIREAVRNGHVPEARLRSLTHLSAEAAGLVRGPTAPGASASE